MSNDIKGTDHNQVTLFSEESLELRDRFVRPFYLQLFRANFIQASGTHDSDFETAVLEAATAISNDQLTSLLNEREWRGRLCAGWFVSLSGRASFVSAIGKLLLASEMVYAGQGYCIALGLIGSEECRFILRRYLSAYLPLHGRVYDQGWAIGALAHLEGKVPPEFLEHKLWRDGDYVVDPISEVEKFHTVVSYLRNQRMVSAAN